MLSGRAWVICQSIKCLRRNLIHKKVRNIFMAAKSIERKSAPWQTQTTDIFKPKVDSLRINEWEFDNLKSAKFDYVNYPFVTQGWTISCSSLYGIKYCVICKKWKKKEFHDVFYTTHQWYFGCLRTLQYVMLLHNLWAMI